MHCSEGGNLQSNGWHFIPQQNHGKTTWLLHRRLKHVGPSGKGCGKTFQEFHPGFMAQLPSPVVECFPFVTSPSGIGIHEDMLSEFMFLSTKGILFGTHSAAITAGGAVLQHLGALGVGMVVVVQETIHMFYQRPVQKDGVGESNP